jgi:hypothetical protein
LKYHSFSLQDPAYHVSRAKLLSAQGSPEVALKQLQEAKTILLGEKGELLDLMDTGGPSSSSSSTSRGGGGGGLSAGDRAALVVEEVKTLVALQRLSEARELARAARRAFKGTPYEVMIKKIKIKKIKIKMKRVPLIITACQLPLLLLLLLLLLLSTLLLLLLDLSSPTIPPSLLLILCCPHLIGA